MKASDKTNPPVGSANGRSARKAASAKAVRPSRFYGVALPGVKEEELSSGTLIVIEGTDGSGARRRSLC